MNSIARKYFTILYPVFVSMRRRQGAPCCSGKTFQFNIIDGGGIMDGDGITDGDGVIDGDGVMDGDGVNDGSGIVEEGGIVPVTSFDPV